MTGIRKPFTAAALKAEYEDIKAKAPEAKARLKQHEDEAALYVNENNDRIIASISEVSFREFCYYKLEVRAHDDVAYETIMALREKGIEIATSTIDLEEDGGWTKLLHMSTAMDKEGELIFDVFSAVANRLGDEGYFKKLGEEITAIFAEVGEPAPTVGAK